RGSRRKNGITTPRRSLRHLAAADGGSGERLHCALVIDQLFGFLGGRPRQAGRQR
ncbi:hypothetical protein HPB47_010017, partial [Ixodes persulcatus]